MKAEQLPAVATVAEVAAFLRVDVRTLRRDLAAGKVPGAFTVGQRQVRIVTATLLDALAAGAGQGAHDASA